MIKIKIHYLIIMLILHSISSNSQIKNIGLPDIKNYNQSEYEGGTQNWEIDQDKNGNIYFANNNGLLQFDGTTWRKYKIPNSDVIRSVKVDSNGKIYVGGYNQFGYFEANEKGRLIYHSLSRFIKVAKTTSLEYIWKIHLFNGGVIFQSFGAIYFYRNNKIQIIKAPNRFQFSFLVNNKLYLQDIGTGILEFKNNKLTALAGTKEFNNTEVWGIIPLSDETLLIATINKGAFLYNNSTLQPWETEVNAFLKKNSYLGSTLIQDKFIAFNTVLNGLIITDKTGKIIQHINQKKGLQNNTILTSFVDNKKNIWLGLDNGIAFINENSPFSYFGFSYDISTVYASVHHNQNLYVATNRGVFYHNWATISDDEAFKLVAGTTGQSWNLQVFDNQLLCGNNSGAMIIEGDHVAKTIDSKGYFGFRKIHDKNDYLIGANYNGFALFEKNGDNWTYKNQIDGFKTSASTFEVDNENIWLKKDNQLYQMSLSQDLTRIQKIKIHKNISKQHKGVTSIQTLNGKIYFQTNNQFYKYSSDQELFFEDKQMSALFQKIPFATQIKQDRLGNIWYAYGNALGVLKKQSNNTYVNNVNSFSTLTGELVLDNISINTIDSKNILIGLTNGLAHYSSEKANSYINIPIAHLRNFISPSDTLLLGNGQKSNKIYSLPYSSNHVYFSFSSPSYENLENIEYSYQLRGFDEKWSPWSRMFIKEYTNLHEGNYVMKVKVRNSYGIQSKETNLKFTISPPWYRHIIAYISYFIIAIALAIYNQKRTNAKIRRSKYYETLEQRRLYLEKETRIRNEQHTLEKEIEKLKNDKLQIKILAKDKELVSNSLQVVKKNKTLNSIIHKLKEINASTADDATKTQFSKLQKSIVKEVQSDKSWKDLEKHIKNVHYDFLKRLKEKYPTVTPRELDLATYLLLNMSTKEIAEIMNISTGGVDLSRHRLRKKFGLSKKENLVGFLLTI